MPFDKRSSTGNTWVSHRHRAVVYMAEKCGTFSIVDALEDHDDWERFWKEFYELPRYEDYARYGVVRNPYSRAVSYWAYWRKVNRAIVHDYTFAEHILKRVRGEAPALGDHAKSMHGWYRDVDLTHVLRFENLSQEFNTLPFMAGRTLKHLNATEHDDWRSYYDSEELMEAVAAPAEQDFIVYGYDRHVRKHEVGRLCNA